MDRSTIQAVSQPRTLRSAAALAAGLTLFALVPSGVDARVFVLPHVLEVSGKTSNTQFTFDTSMFMDYTPGQAGTPPGGGATADLYLYNNAGSPMTNNGVAVCNPCAYVLDSASRKHSISIDDLITAHGPFDAGVKLGFGVIVVGGSDPDNVALQGFVVNSHTSAFDLSTMPSGPQPLGHLCDGETPPGATARAFVLPHMLEKEGRITNTQYTFDTTIYATYTGGLAGIPSTPGGASIDLYLYDDEGYEVFDGMGETVCTPCTFALGELQRKQTISLETLMLGAAGHPFGVFSGYGVVVVSGDADNVNLQGFVVNSHTSAFDVSVFGFEPREISAALPPVRVPPGGEALLGAMRVTPNPARAGAAMSFSLARAMDVELAIYDVNGRKVTAVWNGRRDAGAQTVTWNGRNDDGTLVPAGVYFARLTGEGVAMENRVIALR